MTATTYFEPATGSSRTACSQGGFSDGLTFVHRVLEGWPSEVERFLSQYRPKVLNYLTKLSWDARSREAATTAVDDIFSECFGGFSRCDGDAARRTPLLNSFKGLGSLEGWLKRTARNRFYSVLRRSEYRQRASGIDPEAEWLSEASSHPRSGSVTVDGEMCSSELTSEEHQALRDAVQAAFTSLAEKDSLALIFLRLHFLENVKKQRIAEAWQQHPATVGRRIFAGLEHLRTEISRSLPDYVAQSSGKASETLILACRDFLDTQNA